MRAFTLIELIVVIIIVGILAAVGMTQYAKMLEKSRAAEAKMALGDMRKLAYEYYLQNGTLTGISASDLNLGTSTTQFPIASASCRSSNYFIYSFNALESSYIRIWGVRCTSGGKTPQGDTGCTVDIYAYMNGTTTWGGTCGY